MSGEECLPEAAAHLTWEEAKTEEFESLGPYYDFKGMVSSYLTFFDYILFPEGSSTF